MSKHGDSRHTDKTITLNAQVFHDCYYYQWRNSIDVNVVATSQKFYHFVVSNKAGAVKQKVLSAQRLNNVFNIIWIFWQQLSQSAFTRLLSCPDNTRPHWASNFIVLTVIIRHHYNKNFVHLFVWQLLQSNFIAIRINFKPIFHNEQNKMLIQKIYHALSCITGCQKVNAHEYKEHFKSNYDKKTIESPTKNFASQNGSHGFHIMQQKSTASNFNSYSIHENDATSTQQYYEIFDAVLRAHSQPTWKNNPAWCPWIKLKDKIVSFILIQSAQNVQSAKCHISSLAFFRCSSNKPERKNNFTIHHQFIKRQSFSSLDTNHKTMSLTCSLHTTPSLAGSY